MRAPEIAVLGDSQAQGDLASMGKNRHGRAPTQLKTVLPPPPVSPSPGMGPPDWSVRLVSGGSSSSAGRTQGRLRPAWWTLDGDGRWSAGRVGSGIRSLSLDE
jgi:hypothetical protein